MVGNSSLARGLSSAVSARLSATRWKPCSTQTYYIAFPVLLRILLQWRESVLHAQVRKRCSSVGILLPGMPLECGTTTAAAQTGTLTIWLAVMSEDSASVASSVISTTFCPGSYTNSM